MERSALFKYRTLGARSIDLVRRPALYFALPSTLNDPLEIPGLISFEGTREQISQHFLGYRDAIETSLRIERAAFATVSQRYIDGNLASYGLFHRRARRVAEFEERLRGAEEIEKIVAGLDVHGVRSFSQKFYDSIISDLRKSAICSMAGSGDTNFSQSKATFSGIMPA